MNDNSFTFFFPTRAGSKRVVKKNVKKFAGIDGGITAIKLNQLLQIDFVNEIIVSTDDVDVMEIAAKMNNSKIKIIERPTELCLSTTLVEDLIKYVPTVCSNEHIFWVHATTPLCSVNVYKRALDIYNEFVIEKKEYDSLHSVTKFQKFLWSPEEATFTNWDRKSIKYPNSQDLKVLYEVNHAFYINSKTNFYQYTDRIGLKPYCFELNAIESIDIDWEEDFLIAEAVYEKINRI